MRTRRCVSVLLFALLATAPVASAQTTGSIEGTVIDSTGGALPGVTIEVMNEETGILRSAVTDARGRYVARDLGLGQYRLTATLPGFQGSVRRGVVLTIGREAVVDFELSLGEITEVVEVSGDAPLVDTINAGVANLVSREQMADLPLNGRDLSQLISLQAGTVQVSGNFVGGTLNGGLSAGARISVSGARPSSNVFVLDGTEIQTAYGQLPSGVGGATLGIEALQEFKILTSNYSAQHGRSVGGTVSAVSRAGTNQFRGTTYWYHRNDGLDARNFFDRGAKPEFRRNQFGGSIGGPLVKNRTFFFGNLEALREQLPQQLSGIVPTVLAREGILPTRTVTVASQVKPYLALFPLPNGRDFGDGTAEYNRTGNRPTVQNYASIRLDHQLQADSAIFGRYTRDVSDLSSPHNIPLVEDTLLSENHYFTTEQRQVVSSNFVNQARFSVTRTTVGAGVNPLNLPDPSLSFYAGRPFGAVQVTGLSPLSGGDGEKSDSVKAFIISDDATLDTGRHAIHFGGTFTLFRFDRRFASVRDGAQWEWGSVVNFLQNATPTRMRVSGFNADPVRNFRQRMLAMYVQDDIRVRKNLTLNVGVRFEYTTPPTEAQGRLANLRSILDSATTVGEPYYENPGGFFSPRLGLVWDPTGDGKTSVRTGVGIFHEPLLMKAYVVSMTAQPPFWSDVDPSPAQLAGLFPNLNPHLDRLTREAKQSIHVWEFQPGNPYSIQGNLSVQRQLRGDFVVEIGYLGTKGVNLLGRKQWDAPPRTVVNGETFYAPTETALINPNFERFHYYDTSSSSSYHALKSTIAKRFSAGLHLQGSYTWSQTMDLNSATVAGELSGTNVLDPYVSQRDWGPSDYHVAHVFTGNASYRLPWGENLRGASGMFVRGWQVSTIVQAMGGRPFTLSTNSLLTHTLLRGTSSRPDLIAGGNSNPILGGHEQYFDPTQFVVQRPGFYGNLGRNTLVGPGVFKIDLSVVKEFPLGGDRNLQLRGEIFNVTNRVNLGQPSTGLFNANGGRLATAGRITSASTARQGQLAIRLAF